MSKSEKQERAEAIVEAVKALDEGSLIEYNVRYHVTTRMHADISVAALGIESVIELVKLGWHGDDLVTGWELEEPPGIEGDEVAFIEIEDPQGEHDEVEVDLRAEGEPFSWDACKIVKDMAKMAVGDGSIVDHIEEVQALFARAIEACEVPK